VIFYRYASNIARLVNFEEYKLYGMKSHECHVFMQTLIPITYRDLFLKKKYDALTKINYFFRDVSSNKLRL
jgi:hypothetical protein